MMNIVYSTDNIYLPYCGISIISLLENNKGEDITLYIVGQSLSLESKKIFQNIGKKYNITLYIIDVDDDLIKQCPTPPNDGQKYITAAACIRLFFATILPDNIDKVLYIDSDTIVEQNLKKLWDTDITNYSAGGISDIFVELERFEGYVNSGVLLINLDYWRKNNVQQKFIEYIKGGGIIDYPDQDIINSVLKETILHLPLKYNAQMCYYVRYFKKFEFIEQIQKIDEIMNDIAIVHYTSSLKPWHRDLVHTHEKAYRKYVKISEWKWKEISSWSIYNNKTKRKIRFYKRKIFVKLGLRKSIL